MSAVKPERLIPLAVAAIGILAYANSLSGPFIFDDEYSITGNPHIRRGLPLPLNTRIVVFLSFKLNYALGGLNVAGYHAVNVFIHILAGLLLYGILRRTFLLPSMMPQYGRAASWLAVACAGIWTAHPLHTGSVTYISQRFELMMGLFLLLTLYCFVRASDSCRKRLWHNASLAACALGMGTKEVMAVAPALIALYDYVFLSESLRDLLKRRWRIHCAMFATIGIVFFLWLEEVSTFIAGGTRMLSSLAPADYLFTQFGVIIHYLRQAVFPYPLCFDYAWPRAERLSEILVPGIFVGMLGLATLWRLFRRSPVGFLGAWFFLILAPTSSILPMADFAFEHRMYLPLAAVVTLIVGGAHCLGQRLFVAPGTWTQAGKCALAGLLAALIAATALRNNVYLSAEDLWRDVVEKRPSNFRAHDALVSALLTERKYAEAEIWGRRMLERAKLAQREAVSGWIVGASNPESYLPIAHNHLGRALLCMGKPAEAIAHFREATRLLPDYSIAHHNLGLALFLAGAAQEALQACESAIRIDPRYGNAYALKASILASRGMFAEAIRNYRTAIDMMPDLYSAKLELAWMLATSPEHEFRDGTGALELAEAVCEATACRSARALDALGAALAETGRYEAAARAARRALNLADRRNGGSDVADFAAGEVRFAPVPIGDDCGHASGIAERLRLYQERRPFRNALPPES